MQQATVATAAPGERSLARVVVVLTKGSILGKKWEALKQKVIAIYVLI